MIICADCDQAVDGTDKLTAAQVAEFAEKEFGRMLCIDCGKKGQGGGKAGCREMKIAHTGDLHFGLGYAGPTPSSRFEDITEVADWMADVIIGEGCGMVLVAGDLFKDARVFLDRASVEIAAAVRLVTPAFRC